MTFKLPEQLEEWRAREADAVFQSQIRSLGLVHNGNALALPAPRAFRKTVYTAEVRNDKDGAAAAARVCCYADDVRAELTVYYRSSFSRFDLKRVGRPRWMPHRARES